MQLSPDPRSPTPDPLSPIPACLWPIDRLGDAIVALARRSGIGDGSGIGDLGSGIGGASFPIPDPRSPIPANWIEALAHQASVEAERVDVPFGEVDDLLRSGGPLIVPVVDAETGTTSGVLVILRSGLLLAPDRSTARVSRAAIRQAICAELGAAPGGSGKVHPTTVDALVDRIGVAPSRRGRARQAILDAQLADRRVTAWRLRLAPERPLKIFARQARLMPQTAKLAVAHGAYLFIWVLAWWLIGAAVLDGRLDRGWMIAWALMLLTLVPLRVAALRLQGRLAVGIGALLKERLLTGALRADPDVVSREGAGQLLGRVMEADAMESLALNGGFAGIVAVLELAAAAIVLAVGYSGWMTAVLAGWSVVTGAIAWRYFHCASTWTDRRLAMTNALVERMVGHRTRLAQEAASRWHEAEDRELDRYVEMSVPRDRAEARLLALVPQGWLVVGLLALGPAFVAQGIAAPALAAGLGGIMLAARAFHRLSSAFWQILDARIAWRQIAPLLAAAETPVARGSAAFMDGRTTLKGRPTSDGGRPIALALEADGLVYRYPDRPEPVLRRCSVRVAGGDRILLQGASGSGKSTLVSLLTGLRIPQTGLLLAGGLDRPTLGDAGWRRRVVAAPQFHQNHVITGTLSFNLLMGRPGPGTPDDERDAMEICREMGLGPLIERMPGGLHQMVGETGWQLSQGERSRVFMARALLQTSDVVVLDESFAALDPETMEQTVACVMKRAPALVVVAHE